MTPRSNAEELGILFCLMTVASPLARQYYFMWLFFPITVLIHRAAYDPRASGAGRHLGRAGGRGRPDVPVVAGVSERSAGLGEQSRGDRLIAGGLVWHILHPPLAMRSALSPTAGELKFERQ